MTTKTMKTILFASLIAAMILPFSGMQFVVAEEQTEMSDDKKQRLINKVQKLEERIAQADDESVKEHLKAKQQAILKNLFDSVPRSDTEFTTVEREDIGASTQSGGLITVDGVYTGCNGSGVNWNFAAQTYSSSTWWNVSHYFPNAISVTDTPQFIESVEVLG